MTKWRKLAIDIPAALLIIFGGVVAFYSYQPAHTVITTVKHVPEKTEAQQYEIKQEADGKNVVVAGTSSLTGSTSGSNAPTKPVVITTGAASPEKGTASGDTSSTSTPSSANSTSTSTYVANQNEGATKGTSASGSSLNAQAATALSPADTKNTVTISLKTLDGYMVAPETVAVKDGDTAFDVLKRVADAKGISVDYMGSGAALYVKGIGGWEEKDHGPQSGWNYQINGVKGDCSAGAKNIKQGDKIEWIYVDQ